MAYTTGLSGRELNTRSIKLKYADAVRYTDSMIKELVAQARSPQPHMHQPLVARQLAPTRDGGRRGQGVAGPDPAWLAPGGAHHQQPAVTVGGRAVALGCLGYLGVLGAAAGPHSW
jgi:hypothetical protein